MALSGLGRRAPAVDGPSALDPTSVSIAVTALEAPPETAVADTLTGPLLAEPWTIDIPVLLPAGRIALDDAGHPWWRSADGANTVPITGSAEGL